MGYIIGTIDEIVGPSIYVLWDNKQYNSYYHLDLELAIGDWDA